MRDKLTRRQRAFCLEYAVDLSASDAAIRAGYSEKAASGIGWKLLRHPGVADLLRTLQGASTGESKLTRDFVVSGLMEIARNPKASEAGRLSAFKQLGRYLGPSVPAHANEAAQEAPKPKEPPRNTADEGDDMRVLLAGAVKH